MDSVTGRREGPGLSQPPGSATGEGSRSSSSGGGGGALSSPQRPRSLSGSSTGSGGGDERLAEPDEAVLFTCRAILCVMFPRAHPSMLNVLMERENTGVFELLRTG